MKVIDLILLKLKRNPTLTRADLVRFLSGLGLRTARATAEVLFGLPPEVRDRLRGCDVLGEILEAGREVVL